MGAERNQVLRQEKEGRFEKERIQFHNRVRKGYLTLARKEPRRVKMIDTRKGEEKVFQEIRRIIDELITQSPKIKIQNDIAKFKN